MISFATRSLRARLILPILVITAIAMFIVSNNGTSIMSENMRENADSQLRVLLDTYSSGIAASLVSHDYAAISELIRGWANTLAINYIVLTDTDLVPLIAEKRDINAPLPELGSFVDRSVERTPIEFEGEIYGYLYTEFSFAYINSSRKAALENNYYVVAAALIVTLLAAALIIYYYTRGIQSLIQAGRSVSRGEFFTRVAVIGKDEISSLMVTFNTMLDTVQSNIRLTKEKEQKFRAIADYTYAWENWFDTDGKLKWINPAVEKITGYTIEECYDMLDFPTPIVHPGDIKIVNRQKRLALSNKSGQDVEFRIRNKQGRDVWVAISWQPIYDENGDSLGHRSSVRDISAQHTASEELSYQAEHDSLTGLSNRRSFENQLRLTLDWAQEDRRSVCVFYIDLDQFKVVNDTSGHVAGDQLLIAISKLLMAHTAYGFISRMGGDEFAILYRDLDYEEALRRADSIVADIRNYVFSFAGRTFKIGASIGVVFMSENVNTLTKILIASDTACYAAKERGRNQTVFYDENDEYFRIRNEEFSSVAHINTALAQGRFMLYFQRVEPTKDTDHRHAEILIRMRDLNGGIQSPERFINAAERFNLMPHIDRWVVESVCRQLNEWNEKNIEYDVYRFAINVSGASLSDKDFAEFVADRIAKYKINPDRLVFEITESCMVSQLNQALSFVEKMHSLNSYLALDDFGSGLSSFAYLKQFKVDYLKIDGQFVKNLDNDKSDRAVVVSMIQLANAYGLKTVAEYVCNDEIYKVVRDLGVNYTQGYACHVPEPLINLVMGD